MLFLCLVFLIYILTYSYFQKMLVFQIVTGSSLNLLSTLKKSVLYLNQGGHIIPIQYYVPPGFSDLATALTFSDILASYLNDLS